MVNENAKNFNYATICRCCMSQGEVNIFEAFYEKSTLVELLRACLKEEIIEDDSLPKSICKSCIELLITCYKFVTKYHKVQQSLKDLSSSNVTNTDGVLQKSKIISDSVIQKDELGALHDDEIKTEISNSDIETDVGNEILIINEYSDEDDKPLALLSNSHVNKSQIAKTLRKNNTTKIYECPKCFKKFNFEKSLAVHEVKGCDVKPRIICLTCNEAFPYFNVLEKHCRESGHTCLKRFTCSICPLRFRKKSGLNSHMKTHTKEKPHQCDICGMSFSLSSNLKRHKKRHTGEKSYFCDQCGKGFIQNHTLTIHKRLHNNERPFSCEVCNKRFRSKSLLTFHMYKHKGLPNYHQKHYRKHGAVQVECPVCKKLLTRSGLYTHMKIQHGGGDQRFLCNECGKMCTSKKALEIHMNIHTRQVSFQCDVCLKSFHHQSYLKTHQRIHSGERPHCCDVCGKTFVQRAHLDGHMRTHTGAKPYACTYCDKSFALNGNLKVHMRIHTGETPHHCSMCDKGFFDSSSKRKHEKHCALLLKYNPNK